MGRVAGDGATSASVVLFEALQKRPPGGGRVLPGGAAGRGLWVVKGHFNP